MVVLRAIGRFFARIGRWIRDTAWVQPLLIVGGIFAIIFSIPYLTKWVKSWFSEEDAVEKYYESHKLSISKIEKGESKVNNMFEYLEAINEGTATDAQIKEFGSKFFLAFYAEDCTGCTTNYNGFEYMQKHATTKDSSSTLYLEDGHEFKIHTIDVNEVNDDIETEKGNIFEEYVYDKYAHVFERVSEKIQDNDYAYLVNQGGKSSSYYSSAVSLADTVATPTIFLVDATDPNYFGIQEVIFEINSHEGDSTAYGKALTLVDAWNHKGIFSTDYHK